MRERTKGRRVRKQEDMKVVLVGAEVQHDQSSFWQANERQNEQGSCV